MRTFNRTLGGLFLGVSLVAGLAGCESKVTAANAERIKPGMTLSEVKFILGKGGVEDTSPAGVSIDASALASTKAAAMTSWIWKDGSKEVDVIFKDGKVVDKITRGF